MNIGSEKVNQNIEEDLARYSDIIEIASDWIWEMDADLRFSFLSERYEKVLTIPREDVLGKTRQEFAGVSTDDDHWKQHLDDLANHRPFRDFQYGATVSDGSTRHFLISGKPVFDADGVFKGYRGMAADRTVEVEARKALEESEKQFHNLIEGSIQGLLVHREWNILFANQALAEMFGYDSAAEIKAIEKVEHLIAPEERKRLWGYKLARQRGDYAPEIYEARGIRKDGTEIWLEFRIKPVDWRGQAAIQSVAIDITEHKKAEEALHQQNEHFNAALSNMSQGLCMYDGDQRLIVCNERYAHMYGLTLEQVKPGTTLQQIVEYRIANNIYAGRDPDEYLSERQQWVKKAEKDNKVLELNDGRSISIVHQPLANGGWVDTHEDITDYRRIKKQLTHLAHHDALTGLPNRMQLGERLDQENKRTHRSDILALFHLDLDDFKNVNDTFGHIAGDQLLKIIARRLRKCVRTNDMVARLGGDEFAIIQTSTKQPGDARELAERICEVISAPFKLGQIEVVLGASIGIAVAPKKGCNSEQLLKNANMALYRAKKENRRTYCFFEQEMETSILDRHILGFNLHKAITNFELELHYQPLVNLQNNKISGVEALLRWHHPERGMVSPIEFISIAEKTGLINPIGEWALRQACTEATNWPDEIKIAVNVSPVQFRQCNLPELVKGALAATGLPASRLELEVTESVLLQDEAATLLMLHQLHELGVDISMDDFGTGYSSLSYLQNFPFDKIKIDASFVKDLVRGNDGIGIIQAVVGFASRLGATTVAEGVETVEQLDIIRKEGCTQAQGFYFSRPLPARELSILFSRKLSKGIENAA